MRADPKSCAWPTNVQKNEGGRELLSEAEVHLRYGLAPRSLQRWRTAGGGPCYIRVGERRVLYRVIDIEQWLQGRTFPSAAAELSMKPR